jgi:hypothetical protein
MYVAVRDGKAPDATSVIFTVRAWRQFTDSLKLIRRDPQPCRLLLVLVMAC